MGYRDNKKSDLLNRFHGMLWWKKTIFIIALSLLIGCLSEGLYEANIHRRISKSNDKPQIENVDEGSVQVEGGIRKDDLYYMESEGKIRITTPQRYIDKFQYYYDGGDFQTDIEIETTDEYKNVVTKHLSDLCSGSIQVSIVNIHDYVTSITLNVPQGITLGEFQYNNEAKFNLYRAFYIIAFAFLVLFILSFSDLLVKKLELAFLMISLTIGILIIVLQPPRGMSWDEHIHFYKTFDLFEKDEVTWSEAELFMYRNPEQVEKAPYLSKEEKELHVSYLNSADSNNINAYTYEKGEHSISEIGYIHMSVVVFLGRLLGLPFYMLYLLGKVANLVLYSIVIFFAIKIMPMGKCLLMTLALMPTPLVLATAYSYDVTVIAFLFLGTALIIREFFYPDQLLSVKKAFLIILCFFLGSAPKVVYIPLLLVFVFLPVSKFRNKKQCYIWKSISIFVCAFVLLTMIIPVAGEKLGADTRRENTDINEQLSVILEHPIGYLKILWSSVRANFNDYFLGKDNLAHMAYLGFHEFYLLITVLVFGVALTEPREAMEKEQKRAYRGYRCITFLMVIGCVALIWTALYLSFTGVGEQVINGVQGRYYIPFMLPLFMVFYSDKFGVNIKSKYYNCVIFLIILLIWHQALYENYLITYCS